MTNLLVMRRFGALTTSVSGKVQRFLIELSSEKIIDVGLYTHIPKYDTYIYVLILTALIFLHLKTHAVGSGSRHWLFGVP